MKAEGVPCYFTLTIISDFRSFEHPPLMRRNWKSLAPQYFSSKTSPDARYERGANELPIRHLITLSQYYKVSTDFLLGLDSKVR
jgi:hypothetical protein